MVKGLPFEGLGLLGTFLEAIGGVSVGVDTTTNDEVYVESVPTNITVSAEGDLYNIDILVGGELLCEAARS